MNIEIIYLGHSAFCVKTTAHTLIFDYYHNNGGQGDMKDGLVNLNKLGDPTVLFLASHDHHDHYSKSIAKAIGRYEGYAYVLGGFHAGYPNCVTVMPHETVEVNGVRIHTGASTDRGVCYLVSCDGINIFHAGDNADWGDDDTDISYCEEIDYIAHKGLAVDIAFIPVCYFSGQRSSSMTHGAFYAMEKLSPEITFPIHANGREYLYKEFKKDAEDNGIKGKIVCMERVGERYSHPEIHCR